MIFIELLDPRTAESSFFSSTCGTFTKVDYFLGHKTKKNHQNEIIPSVNLDHSGIRLEISNGKIAGNSPNTWTHNNPCIKEEVSKE